MRSHHPASAGTDSSEEIGVDRDTLGVRHLPHTTVPVGCVFALVGWLTLLLLAVGFSFVLPDFLEKDRYPMVHIRF